MDYYDYKKQFYLKQIEMFTLTGWTKAPGFEELETDFSESTDKRCPRHFGIRDGTFSNSDYQKRFGRVVKYHTDFDASWSVLYNSIKDVDDE